MNNLDKVSAHTLKWCMDTTRLLGVVGLIIGAYADNMQGLVVGIVSLGFSLAFNIVLSLSKEKQ